jgi:mono/diheme cytochrome c family protein
LYVKSLHTGDPQAMLAATAELASSDAGSMFTKLDDSRIAEFKGLAVSQNGPLAAIDSSQLRQTSVISTVQNFVRTIRVLKARAAFILNLTKTHTTGTPPGFGRVDAFGGARNLLFPKFAQNTTAPICWPHLWGTGRITWYHWDGSTNSLLERNVGQALGLGAVFNDKTFDSTIKVANIMALEALATKITAPAWPVDMLGPIDDSKAARGAKLFETKCAKCHYDLNRIDDLSKATKAEAEKQDLLADLIAVRTDPRRADNFAKPVDTTPFNVAVADALHAIIRKAGGTLDPNHKWRVTSKYSSRPMNGIWASPPYLHNGSVPTIYHLLLPQGKRPSTFPLGHRTYDAKRLGYMTDVAVPRFTFDTAAIGNSNAGHSGPDYGTDITEDQRMDLVEYLKNVGASK